MAASNDGQERTEQATAKRLDEARERGQVPRSRELATTLLLLSAAGGIWGSASSLSTSLRDLMQLCFQLSRDELFDPAVMLGKLMRSGELGITALIPLLGLGVIAAIGGSVLLGGLNFSGEAIACKWERLDPLAGLRRMVSLHSLVELAKAVAKVALLMGCGLGILYTEFDDILALSHMSIEPATAGALRLCFWAFTGLAAATVLIALIDAPFQWWEYRRNLRMSRQELRDESKESEGSPEVRQHVRARQQELANRRMMEEVPRADVVITNPSHYAVALRFDAATMHAPKLVAKGNDLVAFKIREVAERHSIIVVAAPPLARAIFHSTKLGREIPSGLYLAVAQVLAYVYQLKRAVQGGPTPVLPREFPIPPDLAR